MSFAIKPSTNAITIAFPDVCKMPAPPGPYAPIPYPNIAKTAAEKQQKKKQGTVAAGQPFRLPRGNEAGTLKQAVSFGSPRMTYSFTGAKAVEVQQLKSALNQLNSKLQNLATANPDTWQAVIQEYAVMASALYVTIVDDGE